MGLETNEPELRKPLQRHGFVGRRTARPTPPSLARDRQRPCSARRHAALHEEVCDRLGTLALLETHAAELATKPVVEAPQCAFAGRMAEVRHPTRGEAVHLRDHPFERDAPVAPGDPSNPVLDPREAFRCETEPPAGQKTMTEEGALPCGSDGALGPIDLEAELAFEERHDRG